MVDGVFMIHLSGGNVISAGVGEDITFDVELIEKFSCRVFLVDPTPGAKLHYQNIVKRFGKIKKEMSTLKTANKVFFLTIFKM